MMAIKKLRMVVLLSGSGRTLENIFKHIDEGKLDAEVCAVIASNPEAYGLERARKRGVPAAAVSRKELNAQAFGEAVNEVIDSYNPDLIVLAGFMCRFKMKPEYEGKVVNIHPGLIPAFCGKGMYGHHVHETVIEYGAKITGCTVHFVDDEYDHGPVIMQDCVPVLDDDTPEALAERVFRKECELYPKALQLIAEGRARIEGRKVRILPTGSNES